MDSVFAYPAAGHYDKVTRLNIFFRGRLGQYFSRHNPCCSAVHKGLPHKSFIKHNTSVNSWNPAFISAMLNTFPDTFKYPSRMKDPGRKLFIMKRRGKTEYICVKNELCAFTGTKSITVHTYNTCKRAAIRVKG